MDRCKQELTLLHVCYLNESVKLTFSHQQILVASKLNPLLDMPILGSTSSAAIKDMVEKIWTNGDSYLFE